MTHKSSKYIHYHYACICMYRFYTCKHYHTLSVTCFLCFAHFHAFMYIVTHNTLAAFKNKKIVIII